VRDDRFRFWMMNSASAAFQGGALRQDLPRRGVDGLSMMFDSRLPLRQVSGTLERVGKETIFRFKAYNLYRRHEPFYLTYPECMRPLLLPLDYARFAQRWREVDVRMQDVFPVTPQLLQPIGSAVLVFNVLMVEILHLDRLFFMACYEPAEDGIRNRERSEAFFREFSPTSPSCARVWEYWDNARPQLASRTSDKPAGGSASIASTVGVFALRMPSVGAPPGTLCGSGLRHHSASRARVGRRC
jgi:hypothetical protein